MQRQAVSAHRKFASFFTDRSWLGALRESFLRECETQSAKTFLWAPVFMACGIGVYFSLPTEPPISLGFFLCVLAFFVWAQNKQSRLALLMMLVAVGFLSAQTRTHLVHTPILQKELGPVEVQGRIDAIEDMGDEVGSRIILSRLDIERLPEERTPVKIRLRFREGSAFHIGQRINVLAKLHPPSPPSIPGGFDFQRYLYFQSIGAVGFVYKMLDAPEGQEAESLWRGYIEKTRNAIGNRVETLMDYPQAGVAIALMTGRKTAITEEDKDAMRHSGLAHMLAISGLHVGLFSGVLFFVFRLLFALLPGAALRYPIKKYAALFAIGGAFIYMLLAGATIPTQRAMIMTGFVFFAIILDRSPISLRLVAFAAMCVLLIFPESLLSASFHMSFAAVTCLILFYDWLRPVWSRWHAQAGIMRRASLYFGGVCITTVVASLATAPFALFHFQQFALYSLPANLIAVPILAFLIMPGIVLALVFMPFGLSALPLFAVDQGIIAVLDTAHWAAGLPHALLKVPSWPLWALVFLVIGFLLFVMFSRWWRLLSLLPFSLSVFLITIYLQPDIFVSSKSRLVSFYTQKGIVHVSDLRTERFMRDRWVENYGLEEDAVRKWPKEGTEGPVRCDEYMCVTDIKGHRIAMLKDQTKQQEACGSADIVISAFFLKECNKPRKLDLSRTLRGGTHAIYLSGDKKQAVIVSSEERRGDRPWSTLNAGFKER